MKQRKRDIIFRVKDDFLPSRQMSVQPMPFIVLHTTRVGGKWQMPLSQQVTWRTLRFVLFSFFVF